MSFGSLKRIIVYVSIHFSFIIVTGREYTSVYTIVLPVIVRTHLQLFQKLAVCTQHIQYFNPSPTSYYIVIVFSLYQIFFEDILIAVW